VAGVAKWFDLINGAWRVDGGGETVADRPRATAKRAIVITGVTAAGEIKEGLPKGVELAVPRSRV
jgi:hypothetical protein